MSQRSTAGGLKGVQLWLDVDALSRTSVACMYPVSTLLVPCYKSANESRRHRKARYVAPHRLCNFRDNPVPAAHTHICNPLSGAEANGAEASCILLLFPHRQAVERRSGVEPISSMFATAGRCMQRFSHGLRFL